VPFVLSTGRVFTFQVDGCCCVTLTECVPDGREGSSNSQCTAGTIGKLEAYNRVGDAPVACERSSCNVESQIAFGREAFSGACVSDLDSTVL
jgi:hypothetical protein